MNTSYRSRIAENALLHDGRFPNRVILPMGSGISILPNKSVRITAHPQCFSAKPDRLLIKHAERWHINRAEIMRFPWLPAGPAGAYAPGERTTLPERRIPSAGNVALDVTYLGPREKGEPFEGCLFVYEDGDPVTRSASSTVSTGIVRAKIRSDVQVRARVARPLQGQTFQATIQPREPFWPQRLAISDAEHWVIHDLRINGVSLLAQDGDLPGILFSDATPVLPQLRFGKLSVNEGLEITATYTGSESSPVLACELSGSATAPDPEEALGGVSSFLPMSSEVKILPTLTAQIKSSLCIPSDGDDHHGMAFQASQIVIADADDWIVHDVRIGNISQFCQFGDVPGVAFSVAAAESVRMSTIQSLMDCVIMATYIGGREEGAPFLCGIAGNALRSA